jgi:competence protein ComFC
MADRLVPGASAGPRWLKQLGNAVIDLLFPPYCISCGRYGAWFCDDCQSQIEVINPPVCHRCGMPLREDVLGPSALTPHHRATCTQCQGTTSHLDGLAAFALHSGPLRKAIHEFKYEGLHCLGAPLGKLMAQGWNVLAPPDEDIDVIVPIPLHITRQRQRGYNQSALLAHELGSWLHRSVVENVLVRIKPTIPQVGLSAAERQMNVRDAFQCQSGTLSGQRVLLVDDVCTTGSTLEAAAMSLRKEGVLLVWAYTLAHAR